MGRAGRGTQFQRSKTSNLYFIKRQNSLACQMILKRKNENISSWEKEHVIVSAQQREAEGVEAIS